VPEQFTQLQVGTPFELFFGRNMQGTSGAIIEQLIDGSFILIVYMDNISTSEFLALREEKINVRVIKENDFLLTLIKYGKTDLIFEMSFDPTLYKDERRGLFFKSNMLMIVGVDSNTNIIKTLRMVSMPIKLFELFNNVWDVNLKQEGFSKEYYNWVSKLDSMYTTFQLWGQGNGYGMMGQKE